MTRPLPRFALVVALALAVGCGSHNKGRLEGTRWSSQGATVGDKELPEGARRLEFGRDGAFAYVIVDAEGERRLAGKYTLGAGDNVTLTMEQPLAGRKQHVQQVTLSGFAYDRLTLTDSDGTSLAFDKVR